MEKTIRDFLSPLITLLILVLLAACAAKSYIHMSYQLPPASDNYKDKSVFLDCRDQRAAQTIFSQRAIADFKHFTGLFSLSLSQGKKPYVVGAYDLQSLFKEAFSRRLGNLGITVIAQKDNTNPVIQINIKKFLLDLVDRTWVASISYEALFYHDNRLLFRRTISGNAERLKLVGQGDAEKMLGEIFTEVVNRLDIGQVFEPS